MIIYGPRASITELQCPAILNMMPDYRFINVLFEGYRRAPPFPMKSSPLLACSCCTKQEREIKSDHQKVFSTNSSVCDQILFSIVDLYRRVKSFHRLLVIWDKVIIIADVVLLCRGDCHQAILLQDTSSFSSAHGGTPVITLLLQGIIYHLRNDTSTLNIRAYQEPQEPPCDPGGLVEWWQLYQRWQ